MHTQEDRLIRAEARLAPLMVIDDDEHLRNETVWLLEARGYEVQGFSDALMALQQLKTGALPDLILLDLMMPGMNGWEFRLQQKLHPRCALIPVIALSADRSPQAAAIDSHAYLTKPVNPEVLLDTVACMLRQAEEQRRELRARELERLSLLGMMAASIAHELNNPLAFAQGNLELVEQQCRDLELRVSGPTAFSLTGIRQLLTRTSRGVERIASLARGIGLFATSDSPELVPVELAHVIDSSLQLVGNELRHVCRVEREIGELPVIVTNPGKLGQVMISLLLEAVRGMRSVAGREHTLRVTAQHQPVARHITIHIAHTGREPVSRASSRAADVNVGFAHGRELIRALGGSLEVEASLALGSTFRIVLFTDECSVAPSNIDTGPLPAAAAARTRRRLLVVDDEALICKLLETALASEYDVVALTQPAIAVMRLSDGEDFDLILCDMMMPDVTGIDLYERVVARVPALAQRFVFMTGGAFTDRERNFLSDTRISQLRKPFRLNDLVQTLDARYRQCIDALR